jgi:YbbR domain-containing protein
LRQVTATRTFSAGIVLTGARSDRVYTLSTDQILVTLGGSIADLDGLAGRAFDVQAAVSGLEPGRHEVQVVANLPAGLALVAASPPRVIVTVALPSASAAPTTAP